MAKPKVVNLKLVRNKRVKDNVRAIRDEMIESAKASVTKLGDDLAGYALVVWSKTDGEPYVSYAASIGPIGPGMLASYAGHALAHRVTMESILPDDDDEDSGDG